MRISDWSSDVCSSDLKGPDGDERHSWLLLPPGYRSGTRLATIVNVYPGSVGKKVWSKWDPDTLNALNDHVLAGRGYAVLYPSPPRSEERRVGKEWVSTFRSRWSPSL